MGKMQLWRGGFESGSAMDFLLGKWRDKLADTADESPVPILNTDRERPTLGALIAAIVVIPDF